MPRTIFYCRNAQAIAVANFLASRPAGCSRVVETFVLVEVLHAESIDSMLELLYQHGLQPVAQDSMTGQTRIAKKVIFREADFPDSGEVAEQ